MNHWNAVSWDASCFGLVQILESMPMTDKVEELLQVIGPFYEIVEDKKNRGSDLTSGSDK